MKTLLSVLAASTMMIGAAQAQEITQFNIGILAIITCKSNNNKNKHRTTHKRKYMTMA